MNDKALVFRLNENGQGPELLQQVFLERGWMEFEEGEVDDHDWNLWWRTSRFRNSDYENIRDWQRVNHFPKATAITKKDCLARNLKRMRGVYGPNVYNFSPVAFNLPNDYTKFVAEYTKLKDKDRYWICKPADMSRGRGIFIFKELSELQYDCNAVAQQYITNPLLISGYKFDLRIYVMVPSFQPMQLYIYQEGLVRFSTEKYDLGSLRNMFAHLTNTSINKHSPSYALDKERVGPGCKWTLTQLRHYFRQVHIDDTALWGKIINIVILTLMIQQHQVPKINNCFELYGFDIIIDEHHKPWLLEVNFSPALSSDCQTDILVKKPMLHDIIEMQHFTEEDKNRAGSESKPKRPARQAYSSMTMGAKSTADIRSRMAGRQRQSLTGHSKLPHIASSIGHSQSAKDADHCSSVDGEEYSMEFSPIVPGRGLPSVQNPVRPHSSGCSSDASSARGSQSAEALCSVTRSQSASSKRTTFSGRAHSDSQSGAAAQARSFDLKRTPAAQAAVPASTLKQRKYPMVKRESKISVQSDSGYSSYSGSSEHSETLCQQDSRPMLNKSGFQPNTDQSCESQSRYTSASMSSRQSANLRTRSSSSSGVDSRVTSFGVSYPAVHSRRSTANKDISDKGTLSISPKQSYSRHLRSDPSGVSDVDSSVQEATAYRTTVASQKRKLAILSLSADRGYSKKPSTLEKPPACVRTATSQISLLRPQKMHIHNKPWQRTKSRTLAKDQVPESPRVGTSTPPERVGDFILVFPFNEVTRKCSQGSSFDAKAVIRESQKILKERVACAADQEAGHSGCNGDKFSTVPFCLWAPNQEDITIH